MIQLVTSVCVEAPAPVVWARLARLEDIQLWSAAVVRARCEGAVTRGVGAERTCHLVGKQTVTVQAERFERAVVVTYNHLNVTASTIRSLITATGFGVGQEERATRVGQQITIPQDSVG